MNGEQEYIISIYYHSVVIEYPCSGMDRLLKERAFLDNLVGITSQLRRPVPDPNGDFYPLDDQQMEAYSKFRKQV